MYELVDIYSLILLGGEYDYVTLDPFPVLTVAPTFSSPNLRQLFDLSRRGDVQARGACTT